MGRSVIIINRLNLTDRRSTTFYDWDEAVVLAFELNGNAHENKLKEIQFILSKTKDLNNGCGDNKRLSFNLKILHLSYNSMR